MRTAFIIILISSTIQLWGQNGYVRLENESIVTGYLRYYTPINDVNRGIEVWRTKKDKNPLKISRHTVSEYAIEKDTFKVLHRFRPFEKGSTYFELVDAKLKKSGKVNLYFIDNSQNSVSTYTGGGLLPALIDESIGNQPYIYVLEDKATGFYKALPSKKDKLKEALIEFFPERYVVRYGEVKGEIKYKSIPALVELYNSK